ncbi:MAG TPA: VapC toxin family PIN domain ribonuclease [Bacteroidales bacterium]|nr:VapC toxin family PIN domain ribonuclease [Bacteroidales bacterium]
MNGNSYLLDTNTILYVLQGNRQIAEMINEKDLFVSFITELELLGYKNIAENDRIKIENFLSECTIVDINPIIKANTIEIRRKYGVKLPDAIVAGTALFLEIPLITADKGFNKMEEIRLILAEIQ